MSKKPNALDRIRMNEELVDKLVAVVNQGATRQVLFGAALDILISKGLITKEELSARADEIFEKIRKPETEAELGIDSGEQGEDTL
jgi:hypothetical protein